MVEQATIGDFVLGLEGLAILRSWMVNSATVKARAQKIVEMARQIEEEPWSNPMAADERTVAAGYAEWATTYDEDSNPILLAEEPIVRGLLARYPVGVALDAACGTGRHTAYLASLGHRVTGIDSTPEMPDALEGGCGEGGCGSIRDRRPDRDPVAGWGRGYRRLYTCADPLCRSGAAHQRTRAGRPNWRACSHFRRPPLHGDARCTRQIPARPNGARVCSEPCPPPIGLSHRVPRRGTLRSQMHRASLD